MKIRAYLSTAFLLACVFLEAYALTVDDCKTSNTWDTVKITQDDNKYTPALIFELDPSIIKLGKPFSFKVALCDDEKNKPDRITANAIMPAHQHGMNYTPKIRFNEESNHYDISGFLFHMPGQWEITISSYHNEQVTHYAKLITIN